MSDVLIMVLNFATCTPVWLCVGMFSIYHLYLASGNSTTIEGWEKDKVATLVRRGKIREIKYPYVSTSNHDSLTVQNIGFINNLKAVLGPNPLLWFWPQPMRGDGLSYPVNPEAGGESERTWEGVAGRQGPLSAPQNIDRGAMNSIGEMLGSVGESNGVQAGYGAGEERMRLSRSGNDADSMV